VVPIAFPLLIRVKAGATDPTRTQGLDSMDLLATASKGTDLRHHPRHMPLDPITDPITHPLTALLVDHQEADRDLEVDLGMQMMVSYISRVTLKMNKFIINLQTAQVLHF